MRVRSHESAADAWGLPTRPGHESQVTIPRNFGHRPPGVVVHRCDLAAAEVVTLGGVPVTSALRTVVDCARTLPYGWGLAVADAALRLELVEARDLRTAAARSRGPGAPALRRVAATADGRAASPLESLLRALLLDAGIGPLSLQSRLFPDGHPYDLSVVGARVLLEADGAEHHREHARFVADCEDTAVAAREGYGLLRFTWYDVTRRPRWTVDAVRRTVERQRCRLVHEDAARKRRQTRAAAAVAAASAPAASAAPRSAGHRTGSAA